MESRRNNHSTETFISLVEKDINDVKNKQRKRLKQNLEKGELEADKEGALIIMDMGKYIAKADH